MFRCQNDFGVLVSLEKLRLCEDQTETKSESKTDTKEINVADESNRGAFTKVKKFAEGFSNLALGEPDMVGIVHFKGDVHFLDLLESKLSSPWGLVLVTKISVQKPLI